MTIDPKALLHRWFDEVWNQGREETIDELFAPHGVAHGLGESGPDLHGPAGFKVFWRNIRSALPDVQIRVEDTIAEADKVVMRVMLEATHTGDGLGVAPTGRRVRVPGMVMIRIDGDQMVEGWNSWDQLGLLQQIGAIPVQSNGDRFLTART